MQQIKYLKYVFIFSLIINAFTSFSQRKVYYLPLDGDLFVYQEPIGKVSTSFKADLATDQNGKLNKALAFNGKNNYGLFTTPPPINNYTISIWVKPEDVGSPMKQSIISAAYMIGKDPCNLYLQNNKIIFKIDDFELSGEGLLQNNKWHHIVMVREPGYLNLFINGKLVLQTAYNKKGYGGDPDQFFIGASKVLKATKELTYASDNYFVENFFKGSLNDLVIVNEAIKIEEIIDLFKYFDSKILPKEYFDRKVQSVNQANATKPEQVQTIDNLPVGGNTALNFDGVDDFVDLPASVGNFANNQPFTVSCWVKPNAVQTKQFGVYPDNDIIEKWDGNNVTGYPFVIRYLNNNAGPNEGKIVVGRYDGKFNPLLTSKIKINDGRWHHIAMVKSVSPFIIKIYIDGNFDGWMNDTCVGVTNNASKLYIGARGNKINFFNGEIDNIRIWSIDKTIEEIKAEMEDLQPKIENLVAAYNFDDGFPSAENTSKQVLRDYLGKNNGTLNNFERKSETSNFILSKAITVDKTPPELLMLSPFGISNGTQNLIEDKFTVVGRVTDESGVAKIFINGKEEAFDVASGNFHKEIKIPFGETPVKITVYDKKQNSKDLEFNFKRIMPEFQSEEILATNEKRYALVIGNNNYKKKPLINPVNDAILLSAELRTSGFEVDTLLNGNLSKMYAAIEKFTDKLSEDTTATGLFFYAGHAMQVNGNNFLLPIDAFIKTESDLEQYCYRLNSLLAKLKESNNNMNIIILDACRDNPFPDPKKLARGGNNGGGLADIKKLAKGTFIAYATAPGQLAYDGVGKNSKYTEELVKAIRIPKLPIEEVFKTVKAEVLKASNDEQQPWESSQLIGKFYFKVK